MITFGIILIILTLLVTVIVAIKEGNGSISVCTTYFCGILTGILSIWGIASLYKGLDDKYKKEQTEFKYPTTEYTLEYEVLTRGEQIDSTYVITKID